MAKEYDLLEEAKDVIEEITDLPRPVPILDELLEFIQTLRTICETLCADPDDKNPAPTAPSPGECSSPPSAT